MGDKIKYQYQVLTWGPCVVKLKTTPEFQNLLLKEGEASSVAANDYQHRLAGIIQKEFKFRDYNILLPYVDEFLKMYTQVFEQWKNQKYQSHFPEVGDLFIFPAWLKHYVAPFKADVERISVSGNISSHIPLNSLKQTDDNKWKAKSDTDNIADYD